MILIADFGGQTAHLIKRRLKNIGVETYIVSPEEVYVFTLQHQAKKKAEKK
jgi:GMP synthase-like glutamine amidotransferase